MAACEHGAIPLRVGASACRRQRRRSGQLGRSLRTQHRSGHDGEAWPAGSWSQRHAPRRSGHATEQCPTGRTGGAR
jgi:hypothetical protein